MLPIVRPIVLLTIVGLWPAPPATAPSSARNEIGDQLDRAVQRATLGQFWGAVLVARGDEVLLAKGYGIANADLAPLTADSLFDIGSVSKQFTAAAVLRLEMDGQVKVDEPVSNYLPNVPHDKFGITIRHLLTHTSGLSTQPEFQPADLDDRDAMVRRVMAAPLQSEPGTQFEYSNVGYFVLAALIETVAKQPFEQYMKERVFAPAGMRDSGFVGDAALDRSRAAVRVMAGGPAQATALDYTWNWGNRGATGVITTARDMLRWDAALRNNVVLDESARQRFETAGLGGYAMGWFAAPVDPFDQSKGQRVQHGGATGGFRSQYSRLPEQRIVCVVLTNENNDPSSIEHALLDVLDGKPLPSVTGFATLDGCTINKLGVVEIRTTGICEAQPADKAGFVRLLVRDGAAGKDIATLTLDWGSAATLAIQLQQMISLRKEADIDAHTGTDVIVATMPYVLDESKRVQFPAGLRVQVLPEYRGTDEQGRPVTDSRITLVVSDAANSFWPVIVKLATADARTLADALHAQSHRPPL